MFSQARYELGIVNSVGRLFGKRKALKFALCLPYILISRENRSVYERIAPCETEIEGRKVVLPHPDARFLDEIVVERCYTKPGFEIGSHDTVIDLGANIGIFTILAAVRARDGRVIALEPEEENFRFLRDNITANLFSKVETYRLAVSSVDRLVDLYVRGPNNSSMLKVTPKKRLKKVQKVESVSMQSLISRLRLPKIDFLKMDIEGAEYLVFQEESWLGYVKRIAMEIHPDLGKPDTIRRILEEHNFVVDIMPARDKGQLYFYAFQKQ